jgi:hypothetical protein
MPVSVDSVSRTPSSPQGFVSDQSILNFEFAARGTKPPVTLKWYEGGLKPENRPEWGLKELPASGMIMVGDKVSLMTGGSRTILNFCYRKNGSISSQISLQRQFHALWEVRGQNGSLPLKAPVRCRDPVSIIQHA